jgi:hypothetical protein
MATGPDANDLIDGELRRYSFRTVCDEIIRAERSAVEQRLMLERLAWDDTPRTRFVAAVRDADARAADHLAQAKALPAESGLLSVRGEQHVRLAATGRQIAALYRQRAELAP